MCKIATFFLEARTLFGIYSLKENEDQTNLEVISANSLIILGKPVAQLVENNKGKRLRGDPNCFHISPQTPTEDAISPSEQGQIPDQTLDPSLVSGFDDVEKWHTNSDHTYVLSTSKRSTRAIFKEVKEDPLVSSACVFEANNTHAFYLHLSGNKQSLINQFKAHGGTVHLWVKH